MAEIVIRTDGQLRRRELAQAQSAEKLRRLPNGSMVFRTAQEDGVYMTATGWQQLGVMPFGLSPSGFVIMLEDGFAHVTFTTTETVNIWGFHPDGSGLPWMGEYFDAAGGWRLQGGTNTATLEADWTWHNPSAFGDHELRLRIGRQGVMADVNVPVRIMSTKW